MGITLSRINAKMGQYTASDRYLAFFFSYDSPVSPLWQVNRIKCSLYWHLSIVWRNIFSATSRTKEKYCNFLFDEDNILKKIRRNTWLSYSDLMLTLDTVERRWPSTGWTWTRCAWQTAQTAKYEYSALEEIVLSNVQIVTKWN